jgi:hypothetical protein
VENEREVEKLIAEEERIFAEMDAPKPTPSAPVKADKPTEKAPFIPVSAEDGISSPFVEDVSVEVQQELHQRRESADETKEDFFVDSQRTAEEVAADSSVGTMSLQDLLDDIRNM